jgi:hypothetical protein
MRSSSRCHKSRNRVFSAGVWLRQTARNFSNRFTLFIATTSPRSCVRSRPARISLRANSDYSFDDDLSTGVRNASTMTPSSRTVSTRYRGCSPNWLKFKIMALPTDASSCPSVTFTSPQYSNRFTLFIATTSPRSCVRSRPYHHQPLSSPSCKMKVPRVPIPTMKAIANSILPRWTMRSRTRSSLPSQ